MSDRGERGVKKLRVDVRAMAIVLASVILPPLGLYLVWNSRWIKRQKVWMSALACVCFALIAAGMFWPDGSGEGGVNYVMRKPEVAVYGPEVPVSSVPHYIAPVSQSVLANDDDESVVYVYVTVSGQYYHLSSCRYYYQSSQKVTPYEAYYLGYEGCPECNPPAYVPGTIY